MRRQVCRFLLVSALSIATCFSTARTSSAEILISIDVGRSWDWLTGALPLFVHQGQLQWWNVVRVMNNPISTSVLNGPVRLQVECCKDMVSRAPVTPSGLSLRVVPPPGCQFVGPGPVLTLFCPVSTTPVATVTVTSASPGLAHLIVEASSNATPGDFIATLHTDSVLGHSSQEVFISVLPAAWPADGPAPTCVPALTLLRLASINPTPFTWKSRNLDKTVYRLGARFAASIVEAGLQLNFVDPGGTGPLPRNVAIVTFKNTIGRPVGIRTVDSRSCGSPGRQFTVAAGATASFSISSASTTTLVFSKSTCRAYLDWFNCWGGSGLGLDDIVTLSEGPFWTLLGGRKVDIETVGDWGAMLRPNSILTIRTP
jgi:hypothetical protein